MHRIIFLFLIYISTIQANEQGCTISFFNTDKTPCEAESKKITIAPIVIPKKENNATKVIEQKLQNILNNVNEYKNKNQEKTTKLLNELDTMKKEFEQYKIEKNREIKKVKTQLYSINKKLKKHKKHKKKVVRTKIVKRKVIKQDKTIHKVIHKMQASTMPIYDTPWIEIVVEDNINIYELALKYYGNSEAYNKIYLANKNTIGKDFKLYNGMTLVIPMTTTFKEQGMLLNQ